MSVITLSRGSYSRGKDVAEKLADKLNYACVSREILLDASEQFDVPESKLSSGIHDAPGRLNLGMTNKPKYTTFIQNSLLKHVTGDNLVYHGLAGHFLLRGIPGILKVRIVADIDYRTEVVVQRDNTSRDKALKTLAKEDEERRKWSESLFGMDPWDPCLYDLVIHIGIITVDEAVDLIFNAAGRPSFQFNETAKTITNRKLMESRVKSLLISDFPTVEVEIENGTALISVKDLPETHAKTIASINQKLDQAKIGIGAKIEVG